MIYRVELRDEKYRTIVAKNFVGDAAKLERDSLAAILKDFEEVDTLIDHYEVKLFYMNEEMEPLVSLSLRQINRVKSELFSKRIAIASFEKIFGKLFDVYINRESALLLDARSEKAS